MKKILTLICFCMFVFLAASENKRDVPHYLAVWALDIPKDRISYPVDFEKIRQDLPALILEKTTKISAVAGCMIYDEAYQFNVRLLNEEFFPEGIRNAEPEFGSPVPFGTEFEKENENYSFRNSFPAGMTKYNNIEIPAFSVASLALSAPELTAGWSVCGVALMNETVRLIVRRVTELPVPALQKAGKQTPELNVSFMVVTVPGNLLTEFMTQTTVPENLYEALKQKYLGEVQVVQVLSENCAADGEERSLKQISSTRLPESWIKDSPEFGDMTDLGIACNYTASLREINEQGDREIVLSYCFSSKELTGWRSYGNVRMPSFQKLEVLNYISLNPGKTQLAANIGNASLMDGKAMLIFVHTEEKTPAKN